MGLAIETTKKKRNLGESICVQGALTRARSSLVPRPTLAAADGLHHRYARNGSGDLETIIGSTYARF